MRVEPFHEGMADPAGLNVRQREAEELSWGGKLSFYGASLEDQLTLNFPLLSKKG